MLTNLETYGNCMISPVHTPTHFTLNQTWPRDRPEQSLLQTVL